MAEIIAEYVQYLSNQLVGIGHRVVHGGHMFKSAQIITDDVKAGIEECSVFAPLHNANSLKGIRILEQLFPTLEQVAVFDTSYHAMIPEHAHRYAIPDQLYREHHLRRYGFHGTSHKYVNMEAEKILAKKGGNH